MASVMAMGPGPQTNDPMAMGNGLPQGYTYDVNGNIIAQGGQPLMGGATDPLSAYYGMPNSPFYNPIYNSSTQSLTHGLETELAGINQQPLQESVQNFADLANRQGPSAWATLAGQQQNTLAENAMEKGAAQSNAQTAQAIDTLGATGGVSSGARERAAEMGSRNFMNMSQDTSRQNSLNQLQIGVNDQQNKIQQMGMLPGMEMQALQPQFQEANMWESARATDVGNAIGANQSANSWNQNLYNQQMSAWGANQQANATANSGKK